jgi:hypothetical protein
MKAHLTMLVVVLVALVLYDKAVKKMLQPKV